MLHPFKAGITGLVHDDDGATMMEYALIAALATVIVIFTIVAFNTRR